MQITLREDEIVFNYGKYMRVKNIVPHGEAEFTIIFERFDKETTPLVHETTHEEQIEATSNIPTQNNNTLEYIETYDECPTVDDVVEYIKSLENYTHDNALIQVHFLGRLLYSRADTNLYHRFKDIISKARDEIEINEQGKWKDKGFRKLSKTRRSKQFTFIRPNTTPIRAAHENNEVADVTG